MGRETAYLGRYTRKLRAALISGFLLFLLSEIMFFGGIFASYATYLTHPTSDVYGLSKPLGVEILR